MAVNADKVPKAVVAPFGLAAETPAGPWFGTLGSGEFEFGIVRGTWLSP